jgi:hypothetical protein
MALLSAVLLATCACAEDHDFTLFQSYAPYSAKLDIAADVAVVYGPDATTAQRVAQWREQGYGVAFMTGIAWGGYDDYYATPEGLKKGEIQTAKDGRLYMHGDSKTVGYNVPTDAYIDYMKKEIEVAVDAGVRAIYLEEPEYWAETGWSDAFKKEWEQFYGEPWQAPDSTVDAQYRASRLKYELYFKALSEVFKHAKERAKAQGRTIECHVPTHSLINYAQWRIVSPESHLMDCAEADGYIAQVWTGTARSHNQYRGKTKERTFEAGYLEYGQMLAMVRPTGRKVWFLADPVEDNPNRSWNDYKRNYECTIVASLMWPEVHRFEVMPWPDRIFQGSYPKVDLDAKSGAREGIPGDYASELLTVLNALGDMKQDDVRYETGPRGVGVLVSDTMMFQRAAPNPSDPNLSSFFGLAMPLVKVGAPVEPVQLENTPNAETLKPFRVLLLTYEGQKPLKPEYHAALADWVCAGGCLIYVGDGTDTYNHVREWWNQMGQTQANPEDDLFQKLGINHAAWNETQPVGKGFVRVLSEKPRQLARYDLGGQKVVELVAGMFGKLGQTFEARNSLLIRRGPYVVAAVMDESVSDAPLAIDGSYVDLFDAALPVLSGRSIAPNDRVLMYDLGWAKTHGPAAKVVAAATRVRGETFSGHALRFTTRGPDGTSARVRVLLPEAPKKVTVVPETPFDKTWDPASSTALLSFANAARDLTFELSF